MSNRIEPQWEWIDAQLAAKQMDGTLAGTRVKRMVQTLEELGYHEKDIPDLGTEMDYALSLFRSQPIADGVVWDQWEPALPGELSVRDIVRVRVDAYTGKNGTLHNGRFGRVVSMRNGVINVAYEDDRAEWVSGHDIKVLEKKIV